ncbi:unnamed protein product [Taenia asiatica]|uniref:Hexosyltransferase n=1 Tax=Taenia asiatica TaxID=60517 RepID=A0A3P6PKT7_TAEAS|nr:unnamed protein product [Taenia asiatica]
MRETLQSLINGKPVLQPPIFNPPIRFLRVPSYVCSPLTPAQAKFGLTDDSSRPNVVIIYRSGVYNFEERNYLRKLYHLAYTDVNIHLIFSIGLPRSATDNEHDDLLVGDFEDSYYNLLLKLFHTFQWAARFCRPYEPIFVFLDDDHAVNTDKLVRFVRDLTPEL